MKAKYTIFLILILGLLIFQTALAFTPLYNQYLDQAAQSSGAGYPSSQASESFINTRLGQIVGVIVSLIGIIFLGLTVFSGIQWMTAGGNEEKVTQARKRVINGTIGVGLTLCAFIIANLYFTFFESKFLQQPPASQVPLAPYGYEDVTCQTSAQCADRNGPTTGQPMFCSNGVCVECDENEDCEIVLGQYLCDFNFGLCIAASEECDDYTEPDPCIYDPECVWVPDPGQEEWNAGNCVDNEDSLCEQCTQQQPFCCPSCPPLPNNSCVECLSNANCESYGTGMNFCQLPPGNNYTCAL